MASFQKAYEEQRLDDAYVLGKRFCIFSLEGLPKHDYFRSPRYANLRKQNDANVQRVIGQLEQVAKWMDEQELERQRLLEARRKRLVEERIRQQQEIERARYQELQQRIERQRRKDVRTTTPGNVEQSALSKLQMLSNGSMKSSSSRTSDGSQRLSSHLSGMDLDRTNGSMGSLSQNGQDDNVAASGQARRSRWPQQDNLDIGTGDDVLPPPMPPPIPPPMPPPPSYDQVVTDKNKLTPLTNQLSDQLVAAAAAQRPITAPAGGAIVGPSTDVLSIPEQDEPLVPPPPYCESSCYVWIVTCLLCIVLTNLMHSIV